MTDYPSIAPTCGSCHTLNPILSKVLDEFEGRVHYVEIDITEGTDIAGSADMTGAPTVQFFKDKALAGELRGMKQKSQYVGGDQAGISNSRRRLDSCSFTLVTYQPAW